MESDPRNGENGRESLAKMKEAMLWGLVGKSIGNICNEIVIRNQEQKRSRRDVLRQLHWGRRVHREISIKSLGGGERLCKEMHRQKGARTPIQVIRRYAS